MSKQIRRKLMMIRAIAHKFGYREWYNANKLTLYGINEDTNLRIKIEDCDGSHNLYPVNKSSADAIITKFRELSRYITKGAIRHYFTTSVIPAAAIRNKVLQSIDDHIHCREDGWDQLEHEPNSKMLLRAITIGETVLRYIRKQRQ